MSKESRSQHSSYHAALIFFPWKNPYPLENKSYASDNSEDIDPLIYASGTNKISGITGIQYNRQKGIGGNMVIEYTGYITDETKLTVGTWCVLATSHVSPITDMESILSRGVIRFIGQIYEISAAYAAEVSGRLSRRITMTVREWCHVLHCPLRYHPVAKEANSKQSFISNSLTKGDKTDTQRSEIIQKIGTSMTNVFQQPALTLAWVGGLQTDQESLLKAVNVNVDDLTLFSNVTARLPTVPKNMLKMLFPNQRLKPETAWADGFMKLLSGVQDWQESKLPSTSTSDSYFGKGVKFDDNAKRPIAPTALEYFTSGGSLFEIVANQVAGGGGVELFADLWYDVGTGGKFVAKPVFVVRDIPYTLKLADEVLNGKVKAKFPWTYYDDLPQIDIPLSRILRVNIKQGIHNTANLIEMAPADGSWAKSASTAALMYFGTTVLTESQKRFGTQRKSRLTIRDIFMKDDATEAGKTEIKITTDADIEAVAEDVKSIYKKADTHFDWFAELAKKQIQWFGTDYLFPSCQLLVKDADYPLACGVNIKFGEYVGHCEGFSQRIAVDESGRIVSQTTVSLSRLCLQSEDGLVPMSHGSVINFLRNPTSVDVDKMFGNVAEKKTYEVAEEIDMKATREIIKSNQKKLNTVFKSSEENGETEKTTTENAPGAKGAAAANSGRTAKKKKRKAGS
ncbi:MAG: hypothetical protein ABFC56_13150 [Clostridiaceae bacterium]